MAYRLIIVSNESGSREDVIFLDLPNGEPAANYCAQGQTVSYDGLINATLPDNFPLDYMLHRA